MNVDKITAKLTEFDKQSFKEFENYKTGRFFAVSYDEIMHHYQSEKSYFRLILKTIVRCFIQDYNYNFSDKAENTIVVFYSHEHARRPDYVNFMKDSAALLDNSYLLTGRDTRKRAKCIGCAIKNLFLLPNWYRTICRVEEDKYNRLYILSKISSAYRWKKYLDKNKEMLCKIKGLVTIFDAREYENILTQYVMQQGIKTATLQHGYFPVISNERGYLAIPYTGFVSDEFWAWGEYSCENAVISGMNPLLCKAVGYPKSFKRIDCEKQQREIMGIILDGGENLLPYNKAILTIAVDVAKKNNLKIVLKPHPHDKYDYTTLMGDFDNYEFSHESIFDYGRKVDFSLSYASSAYIDLMAMGATVFRYRKENCENSYSRLNDIDTFTNTTELENLILKSDSHINDDNRKSLLGDLNNIKQQYNEAAHKLFYNNSNV